MVVRLEYSEMVHKKSFTFMDDINEPLWESVSPKESKQIINVGG